MIRKIIVIILLDIGWLLVANWIIFRSNIRYDILQGLAYTLSIALIWIASNKIVHWALDKKDDVNGS